ncbi:MAG: adenosine kinase [Sphaerochaeta sp.]|jgi:sugar/nucleoside kinase (ribokinase family)|nr:adenosine kinase [Spirochaetales bacterium]
MKQIGKKVLGIGNPLIDIIVSVEESDIHTLGIHKGTMALIHKERMSELLQFLKDKETTYSCGGSCPNTIIALASLGIETTLAGKVGNDKNGQIYAETLKTLNVHNELAVTDEEPTGTTVILVTSDSERSMNTYLGANRLYAAEDVGQDWVEDADFFHFTGYMWDTQSQQEAITKALSIAKQKKTTISFDVADPFAVGRYRDTFLRIIEESCDIVFANREEARILFDNYDPYECCRSMGKLCETAIVKNGKKGSFISHKQQIISIPVKGPVVPVDTTGAGDVYAAGFLYGQCKGFSIADSGIIASILAGQIITQRGAQFSKEQAAGLRALLETGTWRSL